VFLDRQYPYLHAGHRSVGRSVKCTLSINNVPHARCGSTATGQARRRRVNICFIEKDAAGTSMAKKMAL
jgi:hypothetical protein